MSAARSSSRRSAPARDDGTNSDGSDAQLGHQDQSDLLGKYAGPEWSGERDDHADWAWEAMPHLDSMGLEEVRLGLNRWKMVSSDSKIKKKYHKHLRKLFRSVLRMISKRTTAGKSLRLMLRAEFGEERDGYLLLEYLSNYAAEMNPAQIKSLKKEIAGTTFSARSTPSEWELVMQELYHKWMRIPVGKRGGSVADLSDLLLDKMPHECRAYVQYVRAFSAVTVKHV